MSRKVKNNIVYIKKLFISIAEKEEVDPPNITGDNFCEGIDDMIFYITFNGRSYSVEYCENNDEYLLKEINKAKNAKGKHRMHIQKKSSYLPVIVSRILTTHNSKIKNIKHKNNRGYHESLFAKLNLYNDEKKKKYGS